MKHIMLFEHYEEEGLATHVKGVWGSTGEDAGFPALQRHPDLPERLFKLADEALYQDEDYGLLFWNPTANAVFLCAGDGGEEEYIAYIQTGVTQLGMTFHMENECYPTQEDAPGTWYILLPSNMEEFSYRQ